MAEEPVHRLTRTTWHSTLLNFKKLAIQLKEKWRELRIGISTDNVLFIDIDLTAHGCRESVAELLDEVHRVLGVSLIVYKTERGFHVIPCATYFNRGYALSALEGLRGVEKHKRGRGWTDAAGREWWERKYGVKYPEELEIEVLADAIVNTKSAEQIWDDAYNAIKHVPHAMCIDVLHIDISLQRHYTTLRAVPKPHKHVDIEYVGVYTGTPQGTVVHVAPEQLEKVLKCRRYSKELLRKMWIAHIEKKYISRGTIVDIRVIEKMIDYIFEHVG